MFFPCLSQALGKLPPDQHLLLSLRVTKSPMVLLQNKKATVSIPVTIHVLSSVPQGTPVALFQMNGVSGWGGGGQGAHVAQQDPHIIDKLSLFTQLLFSP